MKLHDAPYKADILRRLKSLRPDSERKWGKMSADHARCLRLVDEIAATPLGSEWPDSPTLGRMTGVEVSRLQAKHLNHHLTQFGA